MPYCPVLPIAFTKHNNKELQWNSNWEKNPHTGYYKVQCMGHR
jgi:hypothetical protein